MSLAQIRKVAFGQAICFVSQGLPPIQIGNITPNIKRHGRVQMMPMSVVTIACQNGWVVNFFPSR